MCHKHYLTLYRLIQTAASGIDFRDDKNKVGTYDFLSDNRNTVVSKINLISNIINVKETSIKK